MQLGFNGFITCENCLYGRHLGGRDYGCVNKKRHILWELDSKKYTLVNKGSYTCELAENKCLKQ